MTTIEAEVTAAVEKAQAEYEVAARLRRRKLFWFLVAGCCMVAEYFWPNFIFVLFWVVGIYAVLAGR